MSIKGYSLWGSWGGTEGKPKITICGGRVCKNKICWEGVAPKICRGVGRKNVRGFGDKNQMCGKRSVEK